MAGIQFGSDEDKEMSTDTDTACNVRQLQLDVPEQLSQAVNTTLVGATATQPEDEDYYYDSEDSVLDLDADYWAPSSLHAESK